MTIHSLFGSYYGSSEGVAGPILQPWHPLCTGPPGLAPPLLRSAYYLLSEARGKPNILGE